MELFLKFGVKSCLFIILCLPNLSVICEGYDFEVLFNSCFSAFSLFFSKIRFYVRLICKSDNWIVSFTIIIYHSCNRPYSLYPPSLHALYDWLEKRNVMWYFRGIPVMFVYSVKMWWRFNKQARCTVWILPSFTSLFLVVRTSKVATCTAPKKVTMITSTHNLPLPSLR